MPTPITVTATLNDPSSSALQGNAYVRFRLRNFQGYVPQVSGTSILAEIQIDALPNSSGQISQTLWANNQITPGTTFYTVEFYNQGRLVSSGNYLFNANTNLNSASQLNAPPVPPGFQLVLMNNGQLNSSQTTLNLVNTDGSVAITDLGNGSIQLVAAGAVKAGTNIIQTPSWGGSTVFPQNGTYQGSMNIGAVGGTAFQQITSGMLLCTPSKWKATIYTVGATTITMVIIQCTRGTKNVVSSAAVTFGGLSSPVFSGAGFQQSDAISFAFTQGYDYYFALNSSSGLIGYVGPGTNQAGICGGVQITNSNSLPIGSTLPSWTGSAGESANSIVFDLISA